jgi:hypothetical protein
MQTSRLAKLGMGAAGSVLAGMAVLSCHSLSTRGAPINPAVRETQSDYDQSLKPHADEFWETGRGIFRNETFGSEDFWGGKLRLHEIFNGEKHGGQGPGVTPRQALALGLKVDIGRLPSILLSALQGGRVSLDEGKTTLELLKSNSVVGVKAFFDDPKDDMRMTSLGITCALCHSTVDARFQAGIGARLDGWPNRDLNVGAIVALAPNPKPFQDALGIDNATLVKALKAWGPGRYDAELIHDGKAFRPDGKTAATLLPAAFGLAGISVHTYTGWGSVTHWNAYVAVTQMHGKGTFYDPRLNDKDRFPIAARTGDWNHRDSVDLVAPKLAALNYYQLSLPPPKPARDTYDPEAAKRGAGLFNGKAACARCHVPPLYAEPGWPMHTAQEIGIDDFQASRSPEKRYYRTTPLGGLFTRQKGGYYHDGRFATLDDVVTHYSGVLGLQLSEGDRKDLIEFLKSL